MTLKSINMVGDFSGICGNHGLVIFTSTDSQADDHNGVLIEGSWYWAIVQHGVLTGLPAGPYRTRRAATAAAAGAILDHDTD